MPNEMPNYMLNEIMQYGILPNDVVPNVMMPNDVTPSDIMTNVVTPSATAPFLWPTLKNGVCHRCVEYRLL